MTKYRTASVVVRESEDGHNVTLESVRAAGIVTKTDQLKLQKLVERCGEEALGSQVFVTRHVGGGCVSVPITDLWHFHVRTQSGGLQLEAPPALFARMMCSSIPDDAYFGHSCAHGPGPHEILVHVAAVEGGAALEDLEWLAGWDPHRGEWKDPFAKATEQWRQRERHFAHAEAGRVVVDTLLGHEVKGAELYPAAEGEHPFSNPDSDTFVDLKRHALGLVAAAIAEEKAGGSYRSTTLGLYWWQPNTIGCDLELLSGSCSKEEINRILLPTCETLGLVPKDRIGLVSPEDMMEWLEVRAESLLESHWSAVEKVAERLLQEETLSGDEVRAIVASAVPDGQAPVDG